MIKRLLLALFLLILIGVGTGLYQWFKPHIKVEDAKGIAISSEALFKDYNTDEQAANSRYLNKAIEVSGKVSEVEKSSDNSVMIILDTGDPMGGVQCAMRDKNIEVVKGKSVTIKGFCSGSILSNVSLTDCVIRQ